MSDSPPLESPPPPQQVKTTFRLSTLLTFVFGGLVALLIFGVITWPKINRYLTHRKAEQFLLQAEIAIEEKNWREASNQLGKAYRTSPSHLGVLRKLSQFTALTQPNPNQAIQFLRMILDSGLATDEDRLELAKLYLRQGKTQEPRQLLGQLPPPLQSSKIALEIEANILSVEGRSMEATQKLRQALALEPDEPSSRFKLAILDLKSLLPEIRQKALDTLWNLAESNIPETSRQAINALATETRLSIKNFEKLLQLLKDTDDAPESQHYVILTQMLKQYPDDREATLTAEETRLKDESDETWLPYFIMLQGLGEHERLLNLLPMERTPKIKPLFSLYIDSMCAVERYTELQLKLQEFATIPLSRTEGALLKARLAEGLNQSDEVIRGHLQEAGKSAVAERDLRNVRRISALAQNKNFYDLASSVLESAAQIPQHRVEMLEALLNLHESHSDVQSIINTLRQLLDTNAQLDKHRAHLLYLQLLHGLEIEVAVHELAQWQPDLNLNLPVSFLQAFAFYRTGDKEKLTSLLNEIHAEELNTNQKAVFAGMLHNVGKVSEAFQIAERIPAPVLNDIEKKFLQSAL